jgi:hypothetical protein
VERARGAIVTFLTSLWFHYKFQLGSISNLYAVTSMFAISIKTDRESSRDVIPEPYLENPPVRVLLLAGQKRQCPRVAACFFKNYRALENRIHAGDVSWDYDGVCSIGRLDLGAILSSVMWASGS